MIFEYILKSKGINPATDLTIVQNIDFGSTAGAFSGMQGDYTVEFEPHATLLEKENVGYVVSSLGVESGYVPYTAYCAKQSYLQKNPAVIQGFTNAIQKGLVFVNEHTSEEIAAVIAPQFPESDVTDIAKIVERYKQQDTWKNDTIFTEESFRLLQDILDASGELSKRVPYKDLVTTDFSIKAAQ